MNKFLTKLSGPKLEDAKDFLKFDFVDTEYGIVEIFEYLMCHHYETAKQIYETLGMDPSGKSIGNIISTLFLIKGDGYIGEREISKSTKEELLEIMKYMNSDYQKNPNYLKRLDISFVEAIVSRGSMRAQKLLKSVPKKNINYYYGFGDYTKLFAKENSLYVFKNEEEVKFFEENILTLDPKIVIRIIKAFIFEPITKTDEINNLPFTNYNPYDENTKKLLASPYHLVYRIYKDCRPFFNIFSYTNIENVGIVSQLYIPNFFPDQTIVNDLGEICTKKLRSNYAYLVDSDRDIEDATRKFMNYNSFIEYILMFFRAENEELIYVKEPQGTREYSLYDCIPSTLEYMEAMSRVNMENVFDLHLASNPGDLFVYDFDNTLGVEGLTLLQKYRFVPEENRIYSSSPEGILYAPNGIEKLSRASKLNKPIILTKRFYGGTNDIREFLRKFDIDAHIVPMLVYNGYTMTKPVVIDEIWNYIPEDIGLPEGVKIKTINFADDLRENFDDINKILASRNLEDIKTHLVSLEDEFIKEYLMQ